MEHEIGQLRRASKARVVLAVAMVTFMSMLGGLMASAQPASAWAWDSHVLLNGRAACGAGLQIKSLYIQGANGEAGYASLGTGTYTRAYSFQFNRVPTSTMNVTATANCSGTTYRTSFGLNRPSTGTTATRNLCFAWSGLCLI